LVAVRANDQFSYTPSISSLKRVDKSRDEPEEVEEAFEDLGEENQARVAARLSYHRSVLSNTEDPLNESDCLSQPQAQDLAPTFYSLMHRDAAYERDPATDKKLQERQNRIKTGLIRSELIKNGKRRDEARLELQQ